MNAHLSATHRLLRSVTAIAMAIALLAGCSTPQRMSDAKLESLGVRIGASAEEAAAGLAREGYSCVVSGEAREGFDCSKTTGFLISCTFRVVFVVDAGNGIAAIITPEPACMGTP
ncbi:hypothetical protein SNE35_20630 [Paucibacter sp. R3-3]|uniref:Lipoprotein n=1 Tax=Roseateles agri TaxID=3098619 RepID=A0ABU5DKW6_9BURK|nr:hypothetical protein [Paucibacter sp. R3-3]MDY0746931.1 hypothetical protein [Paucibacter sp. R3-3]